MSRTLRLRKSFAYAFQGLYTAVTQEPNFRIHLVIATLVTILGIIMKLHILEWLILSFTIVFVLILELVNTAMEALVDMVSPEKNEHAKVAKDVMASAVFLGALFSLVVLVVLFLPKFIVLLS